MKSRTQFVNVLITTATTVATACGGPSAEPHLDPPPAAFFRVEGGVVSRYAHEFPSAIVSTGDERYWLVALSEPENAFGAIALGHGDIAVRWTSPGRVSGCCPVGPEWNRALIVVTGVRGATEVWAFDAVSGTFDAVARVLGDAAPDSAPGSTLCRTTSDGGVVVAIPRTSSGPPVEASPDLALFFDDEWLTNNRGLGACETEACLPILLQELPAGGSRPAAAVPARESHWSTGVVRVRNVAEAHSETRRYRVEMASRREHTFSVPRTVAEFVGGTPDLIALDRLDESSSLVVTADRSQDPLLAWSILIADTGEASTSDIRGTGGMLPLTHGRVMVLWPDVGPVVAQANLSDGRISWTYRGTVAGGSPVYIEDNAVVVSFDESGRTASLYDYR